MDSSHYVISEYCLLLSVLLRLYRRWYLKKLKRCIEARAADIFRYIRHHHHHHHHYHHHCQHQHHNGFPANYHALHSVIVIVRNIYKNHHNHTFCFFDTTVWIYFCFLGVDCGNCPNNQRLIVQLLEEWFLFKMSSFTLMMLFSNLENGRAEEEDEQVAAQCLGRKILTKEKATQNSIGKSWNKSYWWQVQGVFSGLQNLCL